MRSKISKKILSETSKETKDKVKGYADQTVVNRSFSSTYCKRCKLPFTKEELDIIEHCYNCGLEINI